MKDRRKFCRQVLFSTVVPVGRNKATLRNLCHWHHQLCQLIVAAAISPDQEGVWCETPPQKKRRRLSRTSLWASVWQWWKLPIAPFNDAIQHKRTLSHWLPPRYFQNQSAAATSLCAPSAALRQLQAFIALLLLISADLCFPTLMCLRHSLPPDPPPPAHLSPPLCLPYPPPGSICCYPPKGRFH